jgi:hypothetical protein
MLATEGQNMAIGRANAGATRAPAPRPSEIDVDVSEDDLRAMAKRGYEGAVTTDHDSRRKFCRPSLTDVLLQI